MNLTRWFAALALACVLTGPTLAQTKHSGTTSAGATADQTSDLVDRLQQGGLGAVLRDGELARALGFDEEQFMLAQDIIDAYQSLMQGWMLLDPGMISPETMQAMMMIRFMMDMELFSILTPEQQQKLEALFQQNQGTDSTQTTQATQTTPVGGVSATKKK
jgi:hypothetical protein